VHAQLKNDVHILTIVEQSGSGTARFGGQAKQGAEGAGMYFYPSQCIDLLRILDYQRMHALLAHISIKTFQGLANQSNDLTTDLKQCIDLLCILDYQRMHALLAYISMNTFQGLANQSNNLMTEYNVT
jgi:hypothetical protein